jgi:hypothetical protein
MTNSGLKSGFKNLKRDKGVSIYLSIVAMSILFSIAFGMSKISITRIGNLNSIGKSIIALYAAETGIERALKEATDGSYAVSDYLDLNDNGFQGPEDATYEVQGFGQGVSNCPVTYNYCLRSKGEYKGTSRALQVNMR